MFSELVNLGKELEKRGTLPSPGYYNYGEPVKWVVALWPDRARLVGTEQHIPRPYSGRTSGMESHLLADEAGYAIGAVNGEKPRKQGKKVRTPEDIIKEKHGLFRDLLIRFLAWDGLDDPVLREAIGWVLNLFNSKNLTKDDRFKEVLSKDWISFVPEIGPLAGKHLFEHERAQAFWVEVMQERSSPGEKKDKRTVIGQCAICGKNEIPLVGKIPLGVKLSGVNPLHSLNADAFTSFQSGSGNFKNAHLGICFGCGDTASRAFNYLSQSDQHRKILAYDKDKRDSLTNQIALFWLKVPAPVKVGEVVLSLEDIDAKLGEILAEPHTKDVPAQATLSQLSDLLKLPWKPIDSALSLNDYDFYLAVLSPNVGRIALREWIADSLENIKYHLGVFLDASSIVSPWGGQSQPHSIATMLQAAEAKNPNFVRGLLRTAYLGHPLPPGLWMTAINSFRKPDVLQDPKEVWRQHSLAGLLKLGLYFGTKEAKTMSEHDPDKRNSAYLCGSLLAILEEAQQVSHYNKYKKRLDTTIVNRFYGSASTAPAVNFGGLIGRATIAHLPDVGRELNLLVEDTLSKLDEVGGFPPTLTLAEQAEFGLGFYHQRAKIRANRGKSNPNQGEQQ